jgi:hypothetical protein
MNGPAYFAEYRIAAELENKSDSHIAAWIAWLLKLVGTVK